MIRNNAVTTMGSDFYPGITGEPDPQISLRQAIDRIHSISPEEARVEPSSSELVIHPREVAETIEYHLAWDITMPVERAPRDVVERPARGVQTEPRRQELVPVQWRYLIDAISGEILERTNVMISEDFSGTVSGAILPQFPTDTPVDRQFSNLTVALTQGGSPVTAETDASGTYFFTGLPAGAATLEAHLEGPHIRVFNNETPDPDATHAASLTIPSTHDWNWTTDDAIPIAETNAFYHVNFARDWFLQGNPFDVDPLPDPMVVYVRDGPYCNASAGVDGLYFGHGIPGACEDFSLCSDIVYHEYVHRIVDKVYLDTGNPIPYEPEPGAMNEAWSDYFGASITNNAINGSGCYTGRDIDTPNKRYPDDWVNEVHEDGRIFAGALWDLRSDLGAGYIDSLALRGMKHAPLTFGEYLGAIVEEDDDPAFSSDPAAANNIPSDGSPNIASICHNFFDLHGIYHDYCAGHTAAPVAVVDFPALADFNVFRDPSGLIEMVGTALGSAADPLQSFALEYAHEGAPTTWLTTAMTLTGGGVSPVSEDVLGQLDPAALADGLYLIRLTVTTTAGDTATARGAIVIDRALMSGWPAGTDDHFVGSPVVANVDPSYPGLEVVAASEFGPVYVWHADGTLTPGWPQDVGGAWAAPAVADLDGDGSLEIVIATVFGRVYVYNHDGTQAAGWPTMDLGWEHWSTPALGDLDGDGDLEIVVGSANQNVYAWHHDGSDVTGWPIATTAEVHSSAAIGDLDGDGSLEVVLGTNDGTIYAWHGDGSPVAGNWPLAIAGGLEASASAALGDLDGDGDLEIVVGTSVEGTNNQVHAWHHDGTVVTGWPKDIPQSFHGGGFVGRPASIDIANLDGGSDLEVIVMANDDRIYVWKGNGTAVAGWPPPGPGGDFYEFVVSSPSVADIDGDGDMEVVAEASFSEVGSFTRYDVYAFHHDGTAVAGWPKTVSWYSNSSPAITDIDLDGDVEILVGSDGIFVWDLPGAFAADSGEWPSYRHDNRRTGKSDSAATAPPQPTFDGVALYLFNGNANDEGANGLHGTIYGGAGFTTDRNGNANGAIELDGVDNYVELPNEAAFDLTEFTIAVTLIQANHEQINWILSKGSYFGNYGLVIRDDRGIRPGYASYVHQVSNGNWSWLSSLEPVPVMEYFNFAVTVSPNQFNAYINGSLVKTAPNPPPPLLNDDAVIIGAGGYYSLARFFRGAIDEIRVYDRALTAAEIAAIQ